MEKIKHFIQSDSGKDILIVIVILLVALSSFLLGRMSKNEQNNELFIKYGQSPELEAQALNSLKTSEINPINEENYLYQGVDLTNRAYFASKRGKKYYPFGCSVGKSIKEENRIYFSSEDEAKAKGYTASSSCD